ncbi:MAG: single-stranded-DNA-specific exonuclease RecJ [Phycisphaerales bacterium]|nr:single-stranded-DNA-specific exonuclease RecJ [Phycisphaerales bacterium]
MTHRPKRWNIAPPHAAAVELAARLKVSPLIAQILLCRGVADPDACQTFLRPSLAALHHPHTLPGVAAAADRLARAVRDRQKIVIYGDYDVDGITATSILWHAVRALGGQADFYVPHRIEEGYGLNAQAVAQLCDQGAQLIVTVDCGITAIEQAQVARDRGVDLIITDHHEWREGGGVGVGETPHSDTPTLRHTDTLPPLLPDACALVHPRLPTAGEPYGNPNLCGAGVAFKLAWGLGLAMSGGAKVSDAYREFLVDATALAALGTIADVVPLTGENRALAHFGLGGLKASKMTGLRALIESAGLTGQKLSSFDVGFKLAPRLNACGRMGHARLAIEMLTTADAAKAEEIATFLEGQNKARQAVEKKIVEQAVAQAVELGQDGDDSRAIVLGHAEWHPGVIGIVASRIVERFHRPTIMVALNTGHGGPDASYGQGSGRSIAGFHLAKALHAVGDHLEAYGGHEMAAGLKLKTENFEAFRDAFRDHAFDALTPEQLVPNLRLDAEAVIPQLTESLVRDLDRLGPFGHANPRPLLCLKSMEVAAAPRRVGKTGDHLQLQLRDAASGRQIKCIGFGYGKLADDIRAGGTVDVAGEPTLNEWNGRVTVEMGIKDLRVE